MKIKNKTQLVLVQRLKGMHGSGNIKQGWTKTNNTVCLQKFRDIDQAYKLATSFPSYFRVVYLNFKLVRLEMLRDDIYI
jgi:hypothetical protein